MLNERYGIGREGILTYLSLPVAVQRALSTLLLVLVPFVAAYTTYASTEKWYPESTEDGSSNSSLKLGTMLFYGLSSWPLVLLLAYSLSRLRSLTGGAVAAAPQATVPKAAPKSRTGRR